MRRRYLASLVGSIAFGASAFLPWLRLGDTGLSGVPDPAGYFVLALGCVGAMLTVAGLRSHRDVGQWLGLVGLAGATTLVLVWTTGPSTIAERARARAEAVAIVDNVSVEPPPPVRIGPGLLVGLAAAALVSSAGLTGVLSGAESRRRAQSA